MSNSHKSNQTLGTLLLLALCCGTLAGCTGTAYIPPSTESAGEPASEPEINTDPEGVKTESDVVEPPANAARNNAAGTLLAQSETLRQSGQLPQAVALVERAIRLEPRRGDLWVQLGRLRFESGELARAEQYARKGIALTRSVEPARRLGWLLLADVSEAQGDAPGAQQIRSRWLNDLG